MGHRGVTRYRDLLASGVALVKRKGFWAARCAQNPIFIGYPLRVTQPNQVRAKDVLMISRL
jgi:hypothetical protein